LLLPAVAALASAIVACSPDAALDAFNEGSGATSGGVTTTGAGGSGTTSGSGGATTTGSGGGTSTSGTGGAGGAGGAGGGSVGPACGDGEVNAAGEQCDDGNTGSGDGCSAACVYELSDGCPEATLVVGTTPLTFMGDTVQAQPDLAGTCGGTGAGEYVFLIQAGATGTLAATLEGNFSGTNAKLLWIHAQCPADQAQSLACNAGSPAQLAFPVTEGETLYLGADGQQGSEGPFVLTLVIQ
jgi:cysteine-rich repeat protein